MGTVARTESVSPSRNRLLVVLLLLLPSTSESVTSTNGKNGYRFSVLPPQGCCGIAALRMRRESMGVLRGLLAMPRSNPRSKRLSLSG